MKTRNSNNIEPLRVAGRYKGYSKEELKRNLPRHCKFSPYILKQINNVADVTLRNSGSPLAKKINRMMKEVFSEAYRAKQFTRTEINNRGVLYGVVLLKHDVIDLVLRYFHERWPKCIVCLYNEHSRKTSLINEKGFIKEIKVPLIEVVEMVSEKHPIMPYFDDIQFSGKDIFETLYKSQFIKKRENPHYFKQMIPDHCYKLPGMRNGTEKRFLNNNRKLDEYIF